ncbi:MAG: EutN/CcmL family microcompartment protein [Holophagae bacterium]
MKIGQVTGTVVSTIHLPIVAGRRLLLVDLQDLDGRRTGNYVIAVDTVDAGAGETVLVLDEGNGARQVLGEPDAPVRAVIVGVVDEVTCEAPASRW